MRDLSIQIEEEVDARIQLDKKYLFAIMVSSFTTGCAFGTLLYLSVLVLTDVGGKDWSAPVLLAMIFCIIGVIFADRALKTRAKIRRQMEIISGMLQSGAFVASVIPSSQSKSLTATSYIN